MAETVGLKLEQSVKKRLKSLGIVKDRSPHWLMRQAILTYVEREEIYEKEKREDHVRWERYALTGEAVTHTEVTSWLDRAAGKKPKAASR